MISIEEAVRKNDAVMKILNSLSKGASFGVSVECGEAAIVSREKCGISFREPGGEKPDFVVSMQKEVFEKLFSEDTSNLSVGDFLVFAAKLLSGEKEKVVYIGQGRFGVLYFENPRDQRKFTIKKVIEWEDRDKKSEWREELSGLYSKID